MKVVIACLALFLFGAAPPYVRPQYAGPPPFRYMADNIAIVAFTSNVEGFCGAASPGYAIAACYRKTNGRPVIVLPNPCLFPDDPYAVLACHEKGHQNGWPGDHPFD